MVWWTLLAGAAVAGTGDPTFDRLEGRPHCFPLSIGVQALAELERLDGRPVFLEELSTCGGDRPDGAPVVLPPERAHGRAALRALVKAQAGASDVRYTIERRADGWLVAPVGVDRVFDVPVGIGEQRFNALYALQQSMFRQVADAAKVWLPVQEVGFGGHNPDNAYEVVPFDGLPLLEGLVSVYGGLDPAPVGFVVRRQRPEQADPEGLSRGLLVPLYVPGTWPVDPPWPVPPARPSCHPLTAAIRALVRDDRVDGRPVFVEEWSLCTQQRPAGVEVVAPPPEATGRAALQAVVDAHAAVAAPVARYEVGERAGGWWIAPVGVEHVADVPVTLEADRTDGRLPAANGLGAQVTAALGVRFGGPADPLHRSVWDDPGPPQTVSFTDLPLLEALVELYRPREYVPTGFALLHAPNRVDPERLPASVRVETLSPMDR